MRESADFSDTATLFQAYVDLINSERETIWARHNALLVANSLIVGALALSPTALGTNRWAGFAVIEAGLLISTACLITIHGWLMMRRHAEIAGTFTAEHFQHLPNPFADLTYRRSGLWIHGLALAVIGIFIAIYLGLGLGRALSGLGLTP
jgi:hypothetical protein